MKTVATPAAPPPARHRLPTAAVTLLAALVGLPLSARASTPEADARPDSCRLDTRRATEHQWLYGIGRANVLDTYLSPLEYTGTDVAIARRTERLARWGRGHVTTHAYYSGHFAYVKSPTDDGKEWDGELTASGGWLYNLRPSGHWRIGVGGLMELTTGFTYNLRGTNNPAQGRLGTALLLSALAEYSFTLRRRTAVARLTIDSPMAGVQFAPEYGQSYYEIFSLGHSDGVVRFTHPGNAPSCRLTATVQLPLRASHLTLGYTGDVRQSRLNHLKRHAWRNCFMIGYTRSLYVVRR